MCAVQIQPRKLDLDHADYTAPTRQHELDPTEQESIFPEGPGAASGNLLYFHVCNSAGNQQGEVGTKRKRHNKAENGAKHGVGTRLVEVPNPLPTLSR